MNGSVIDTRLANALFAEAKMNTDVHGAIGKVAGAAGGHIGVKQLDATLDSFADAYGGLWVGGKATLTDVELVFEPNALNRALHHEGAKLRLDLPLKAIEGVETRFGWFTGIIDVRASGKVFSMRCYGSKTFAAKITAARAALRS